MRRTLTVLVLATAVLAAVPAAALDRAGYDEMMQLMQTARDAEADVFAPRAWAKAEEARAKAEQALTAGRKQEQLDKQVAEAREFVENARKATDVCRLALQPHLPPRDLAAQARAAELVPAVWGEAQARLLKATARIEAGDTKGGLQEAAAAAPLFDRAELAAIRVAVLGEADRLIAKAELDEAAKYALATLDRARTARRDADALLTADRTRREAAASAAAEAEYEARHASTIAQSVRSLVRNDQAWEKLMLLYEIQMNRAGEAFHLARLPFDDGPQAAADTLVARARAARDANAALAQENDAVTQRLRATVARLGAASDAGDGAALVARLDRRLDELMAENRGLAADVEGERARLAALSQEHAAVADQLSARVEREAKFRRAKDLITAAEGDVLYTATNDVLLRLSGLAFDSGSSELRDSQIPLLEKVKEIVRQYDGARIMVEGHTDSAGDPGANQRLSERRALAVMQYLRSGLDLSAERIQALGFGAERPVASNQSAEGRGRNRRIDIVIMR